MTPVLPQNRPGMFETASDAAYRLAPVVAAGALIWAMVVGLIVWCAL